MKITSGNVWAEVKDATPTEEGWLNDYLVFEDPNAHHIPSVKQGLWDGKHRLYDKFKRRFLTGLLPLVLKRAPQDGIQVVATDQRSRPPIQLANPDLSWLRDYQLEAVDAIVRDGRGIVRAPTGSGKTEIVVGAAMRVPCVWLVLVDTKDLMHQMAERFELRTGEEAGRFGDGEVSLQRFTVATFQSLHKHKRVRSVRQFLDTVEGVVVDECHVSGAETFLRTLQKVDAYWRVGVSATPLQRGDKRNLLVMGATGRVIYRIDPQVLIDRGLLARPRIRMVRYDERHATAGVIEKIDMAVVGANWQEVYRRGVVEHHERNAAVVAVAQQAAKPCLLFVREIDHGKRLLGDLRRAGVSADFVWGTDPTQKRRDAVGLLENGDTEVLVTSAIFNKGIDIPSLRSLVVAAGGKAVITTIQRLGRGMRVVDGKKEVELWDFDDRHHVVLRRHTRQRRKAYGLDEYEVEDVNLEAVAPKQSTLAQ